MESVAARLAIRWPRALRQLDTRMVSVWGLTCAVVLYLALDGGGYDVVVRNQVGVVVWWAVLVAAAVGVIPGGRLSSQARGAIAMLGAFVVWTALAATWSQSSERSLDELSRVACYLGVLLLALMLHRDRETALRNTLGALGTVIVAVAAVAVISRLRPGSFSGAGQTAAFLPGSHQRLAWPLNYWNGLAALMAVGLPLLLAIAASARRLIVQAIAAGAVPLVALCAYLTFSRGGALATAGGLIVFYCLAGDRIPKILTGLLTAAGSAVLIAGAAHRSAIENGLTGAVARHQGSQLLVALVLVCAGTAIAQAAIALAVRHGTRPRLLVVTRARARLLLAGGLAVLIALALAVGVPSKLSHAWSQFKRTNTAALSHNNLSRFGSASGNGRYEYWKVAVQQSGKHLAGGWGPGTFQLVWLPHAPNSDYVENAHSLYVETLLEDGAIGLAVLVGFFAVVLGSGVLAVIRSEHEVRTGAAAVTAGCVAFSISAAADWVWQIPVLPVCFLLLGAAAMAPARRRVAAGVPPAGTAPRSGSARFGSGRARGAARVALVAVSLASLVAIVVPLTMTNALRQSQSAATSGDLPKALSYARVAAQIEPGAASPRLQEALVLEQQHHLTAALAAARQATANEPLNWSTWLVRSRLEVETGQPAAAVYSLRQARLLNPHSSLWRLG